MTELIHAYVDHFAHALKFVSVAIIVGGTALATWSFVRDGIRTGSLQSAYPSYRGDLGAASCLGLSCLYPLYEVIAEHKLPAIFHSGHSGIGTGMT